MLKPVDALVHVVRCFEDPEILHAAGSVDPARDVHELDLELVLADHDLVSRRLDKLAQATKRGLNDDEKREQALLAGVVLPCARERSSRCGCSRSTPTAIAGCAASSCCPPSRC